MALSIITGLLMIVLGGLFLTQPGLSLASIIWLTGIFTIAYGLFLVIAGIAGRHDGGGWAIVGGRRIWLVILGLIGIAVGIYFFVHPITGILALLWVAGIYLVVLGVFRIVAGFMQPPRPQAA